MIELCCEYLSLQCMWLITTYSQMHLTDKYSQHSSIIWSVWLNGWVFIYKLTGCEFESYCCHLNFRYCTCFQATIECRFILKHICNMIITYRQMQCTDKYSQHSSIIWPVWLNGWVFLYKCSGCGFESHCFHLNFRYGACFKQGIPWHSGNYTV